MTKLLAPMGEQDRPVDPAPTSRRLEMLHTPDRLTAPTFGPTAPTLSALRGLRFFSDERNAGGDGANGDQQQQEQQGGGNGGENSGDTGGQQQQGDRQQGGRQGTNDTGRTGKDGTFSREYVSELRTENSTRRKNEAALETRAQAAERERDELRAEVAEGRRRDAVTAAATDGGANAALLLDSDSFKRATKDVDLTKKDDVVAAIKTFVTSNPHYAVAPPAGSSGSGRAGGAHSGGTDHANNLAGAVGAALTRT